MIPRPGNYLWFVAAALLAAPAAAQDINVRVVDVGAGLCVIAATDDGHVMVYDTGAGSKICGDAVDELAPAQQIDLLILSHSDIDHIGAVRRILADHHVRTLIHPGDPRDGAVERCVSLSRRSRTAHRPPPFDVRHTAARWTNSRQASADKVGSPVAGTGENDQSCLRGAILEDFPGCRYFRAAAPQEKKPRSLEIGVL